MADQEKVKRYSISERKCKVHVKDMVQIPEEPIFSGDPLSIFPDILSGQQIRQVADSIIRTRKSRKTLILMMGAHAIKCGLSPIIISLMDMGAISHIATNGAVAIHDFEMAFNGGTSEDVATAIEDGSFGMALETGQLLNNAYIRGAEDGIGMGHSVSRLIHDSDFPHKDKSIFCQALKADIPITVHACIGTDIIFQHPECSGSAIGKVSYTDFLKFSHTISNLEGGMVINLGSAVIMPEVFLKALTLSRNRGNTIKNFTAVNIDRIDQYRPRVNVLDRPTSSGGKSIFLQGPMEILLPLIFHSVMYKGLS